MLRRLNYTGRKRIQKSSIKISIIGEEDEIKSFRASIDLNSLDLPGDARVFFEAWYRMMQSQRYAFGTISKISHPEDTSLGLLGLSSNLKFRVSVVDESGKILALAERIDIEREDKKTSLLPVDTIDLDNLLWNVSMEGDEGGPILELNQRIPAIKTVAAHDPRFIHSVYPAVVREILMHMAVKNNIDFQSPNFDWQNNWLRFSERIFTAPPEGRYSDAKDEILEWIDGVVQAFATFRKRDWSDPSLIRWDL